jgi:ABC-type multidrug transport system, permease component
MTQLAALTKKEFLLVIRDRNALLALFVLPAIFILIMSLALRDTYDGKEALLTYIFSGQADATNDRLAVFLEEGGQIRKAKPDENAQFTLKRENGGGTITATVDYRVETQALALFRSRLDLALLHMRLAELTERFGVTDFDSEAKTDMVSFVWNAARSVRPSPSQQSVPSWIIFGMFFVVIPLSNVFITERRQNTLTRLRGIGIGFPLIMVGKILPYFFINQVQTTLMILTGIYLTPLCGGEALTITGSLWGLTLISSAVSFSAIGVALFIATVAQTAEQASTMGGIINVLFGAIGGIMVPKFLMPDFMQRLAMVSPMSWGLDGFLKIFVKGEGIRAVGGESAMLFLFGLTVMALAMAVSRQNE